MRLTPPSVPKTQVTARDMTGEGPSKTVTLYDTTPDRVMSILAAVAERGPEMAEVCGQLADALGKRHEAAPLMRKLQEFFAAVAPEAVPA